MKSSAKKGKPGVAKRRLKYPVHEHPRGSGIRIAEIPNKTGGRLFGVSYQVRIPGALLGKIGGREMHQRRTLAEAQKLAEDRFLALRRHGTTFSNLPASAQKEAVIAWGMLQENGISFIEAAETAKAPVRSHLSNAQIQEAEAVFSKLAKDFPQKSLFDLATFFETLSSLIPPEKAKSVASALTEVRARHPGESLAPAILYYIRNYRVPTGSKTLHDALTAYLAEREREKEKRSLSNRQYVSIGWEMDRLEKYFGSKRALAAISHLDLQDYLRKTFPQDDEGHPQFSNKTWNNRRGYLCTFFGFCVSQGWRSDNPGQGVTTFEKPSSPAERLSSAARPRRGN